jgi:hypothetical protein
MRSDRIATLSVLNMTTRRGNQSSSSERDTDEGQRLRDEVDELVELRLLDKENVAQVLRLPPHELAAFM